MFALGSLLNLRSLILPGLAVAAVAFLYWKAERAETRAEKLTAELEQSEQARRDLVADLEEARNSYQHAMRAVIEAAEKERKTEQAEAEALEFIGKAGETADGSVAPVLLDTLKRLQ